MTTTNLSTPTTRVCLLVTSTRIAVIVSCLVAICALILECIPERKPGYAYILVDGVPMGGLMVVNHEGHPVYTDPAGRFRPLDEWIPGSTLMIFQVTSGRDRVFLGAHELQLNARGSEWELIDISTPHAAVGQSGDYGAACALN